MSQSNSGALVGRPFGPRIGALALFAVACGGGEVTPSPGIAPEAEPEVPEAPAPKSELAEGMDNHWTTATAIRDRVLHGDLAGSRVIARGLAEQVDPDAAPEELRGKYGAMREAAGKVAAATSTDEAGPAVGALALTCAECHNFADGGPKQLTLPLPPPEIADPSHDMAVHQWALDWLWVGLIANDAEAWNRGAGGLEKAPFSTRKDLPRSELGLTQMEKVAHLLPSVAESGNRNSQADRFGETLAVCAMCHSEAEKAGIKSAPPIKKE